MLKQFLNKYFILLIACWACYPSHVFADASGELMLAKKYHDDIDITKYFVSEKLDGVRARWDGKNLISRGGYTFSAPDWFVAGFPKATMDGELWIARGQYEKTSSIVSRFSPHDGWHRVRFMMFDLPLHGGTFEQRVMAMRELARQVDVSFLAAVDQLEVDNNKALMKLLDKVIAGGGEGLMLHRKTARYKSGRSDNLLKLKRFDDAEAVVIGYKPGTGKYEGMTGSLKVKLSNGKTFYIGSGLDDSQRTNPPPVGSLITFRHQGYTKNNIPRFPVFIRERAEEPQKKNSD